MNDIKKNNLAVFLFLNKILALHWRRLALLPLVMVILTASYFAFLVEQKSPVESIDVRNFIYHLHYIYGFEGKPINTLQVFIIDHPNMTNQEFSFIKEKVIDMAENDPASAHSPEKEVKKFMNNRAKEQEKEAQDYVVNFLNKSLKK